MTDYSWMRRGVTIKAPGGELYTVCKSPRQVFNSRPDDDGWRVWVDQVEYSLHCQLMEPAA